MIQFNKFTLDNGLTVLVHEDPTTHMATLNVLYKVGARDEQADKTGFAHLFEHLMFGGSANIPNYDRPLEMAGGTSNAFTNPDITNYYNELPAMNIETAFWLESDRMLSLDISQEKLDIQKNVVIEEFKENYINQPYGDVWHKLLDLSYDVHPYKWPTIGKDLSHIEQASLKDVSQFYKTYYSPNNAVLVVAGGVKTKDIEVLAKKWFNEIPRGQNILRNIPKEPEQLKPKSLTLKKDVPVNIIYKAWHMCSRNDPSYQKADLMSDILGSGPSSRMHLSLVKDKKLFSSISSYVSGSLDAGLFIVSGKLMDGVRIEDAEDGISEELNRICDKNVGDKELQKVKNQIESYNVQSDIKVRSRAQNLAYYEMLGNANLINDEIKSYLCMPATEIKNYAQKILTPYNCTTLYYLTESYK